jgi:hypothetical protein
MPNVSISEAARLTKKPRSTLHRHMNQGKLSKHQDGQGNPVLDVAELERVYGALQQADMPQTVASLQIATPSAVAVDRAEIEALRRENALLQRQLEDTQGQRDRLLGVVESQTRLITHLSERPAAPARPSVLPVKKGSVVE